MPRLYLGFSAPEKFLNSSTSYNRAHHRFAVFVVCATFVLLIAGGLVTSNDASLAVPDWPTSFGSFHMPRMVGGVLYEHGHRLIAASITLPKPPQVTCMSIGPGTLTVGLRSVRGPAGTYAVRAAVGSHRFTARLRIP